MPIVTTHFRSLFIFVLDYVVRATESSRLNCGVKTHSDATLQNLDFDDDTVTVTLS